MSIERYAQPLDGMTVTEGARRPSAAERFAAMTEAEQDEAFGPATAKALRNGDITFADLVQRTRYGGDADNFITQASLEDASRN